MKTTTKFEVTGWNPVPYDESIESAKLSRVTITKTFTGALEGESTAEGLFCGCDDGSASYVVLERVTGKLDGREGTFVMQHGGIVNKGEVQGQFGDIIPGSGTDGFAGIGGTVLFKHDDEAAVLHLDITFE
jgi:hypothetical protein